MKSLSSISNGNHLEHKKKKKKNLKRSNAMAHLNMECKALHSQSLLKKDS